MEMSENNKQEKKMAATQKEVKLPVAEEPEFAYLPPPTQDASIYYQEGVKEKLIRKTKQNPFIIVGVALTTFALTYGVWQLKTGNRQLSQSMMRLRIVAQGSTVLAVLGGVFYGAKKSVANK